MHAPDFPVAATCVRVPVVAGHSESVYIEIDQAGVTVEDIKKVLQQAPGVIVQDDITAQEYPMPIYTEGEDEVFVGRIRKDLAKDNAFHLWVVSDNLLKGAALNSIQIAERMIEDGLI
jgi:aspartate semialdehyde dehydrogenase (EC 1.2.1.11)